VYVDNPVEHPSRRVVLVTSARVDLRRYLHTRMHEPRCVRRDSTRIMGENYITTRDRSVVRSCTNRDNEHDCPSNSARPPPSKSASRATDTTRSAVMSIRCLGSRCRIVTLCSCQSPVTFFGTYTVRDAFVCSCAMRSHDSDSRHVHAVPHALDNDPAFHLETTVRETARTSCVAQAGVVRYDRLHDTLGVAPCRQQKSCKRGLLVYLVHCEVYLAFYVPDF
jgi:hypothetical protein